MPTERMFLKCLGRFLVLVAISLPWVLFLALLPFQQLWVKVLKYIITFFGWTLTLAFVLDTVCLKLKLYDAQ